MHLKSSAFPGPLPHAWQPRAILCPLPPSLVLLLPEERAIATFSVRPLMNSEKSTVSLTSRSRRNACARRSGALPRRVYINSSLPPLYHLLWLGVLDKPIKQMGFNEGSQKCKGLIFHWYSPILHFFFNFIYLGRASSWRILVWDQSRRCADVYISGQKLRCSIV